MPEWMVLVPFFGRDYKSRKEVELAWSSNKDFVIAMTGQTISKSCAPTGNYEIRYGKLAKLTVVRHKAG
jgi:hypothetical protein